MYIVVVQLSNRTYVGVQDDCQQSHRRGEYADTITLLCICVIAFLLIFPRVSLLFLQRTIQEGLNAFTRQLLAKVVMQKRCAKENPSRAEHF